MPRQRTKRRRPKHGDRSGSPVRSAVYVVLTAATLWACHGGSGQGRSPVEPVLRTQPPAAAVWTATSGNASVDAGAIDEGMPKLAVVLEDLRLAAARANEEMRDDSAAAREVDVARATATLGAAEGCAWDYVAGRLHLAAGEMAAAAAAFERVVTSSGDGTESLWASGGDGSRSPACPLAPYAALRDAEALVRLGRGDEALARARAAGDEIAEHDELRLALADAYATKGDRLSAVPIWRELLAASPTGLRWADTSILLATALLDGIDGPPKAHASEALELATRVLAEAPWVQDATDVAALRARASALLGARAAPPLTPDERARQAQAWLDFAKPRRATEVAEALLAAIADGDKKNGEALCRAAIVRAQAIPRGKSDAIADGWKVAIARCERAEALVTALYQGAKASASARRYAEASGRFERVEKLFPVHRFADDARFRNALVAYEQGDEAKYVSLLSSIPDAYPDGDMKGEAIFRVALAKLSQHDFDEARAMLDRLLDGSLAGPSAARAAYFRGRVAQLAGDTEDAKARYLALVVDQPLGYYMLLSYARLRAIDESAARSAIEAAMSREPAGPFLTRAHPELSSIAFDRFARLLEVGEVEAARREARIGGLTADGVDPEVVWALAWLYNRSGAPEQGHAFARGRLVDYRAHWPVGRWRFAWQVAYPRPWEGVVVRESESSAIPAALTWAVMREESAFDPDAHSGASAIGLMQLLASTVRQMTRGTPAVVDDAALHRPDVSIAMGARFLGSLRSSFGGNPALAIAAYNGGGGSVRKWLNQRDGDDFDVFVERIPFDETRAYVKRVLSSEAAYAFLYAPQTLDELLALPMRIAAADPSP